VTRRTTPVKPGAKRGQPVDHVLHEIIVHLGVIHDQDLSPLGRKGHFDVLTAKTRKA